MADPFDKHGTCHGCILGAWPDAVFNPDHKRKFLFLFAISR
jgi:hypothetical protein